VLLKLLEGQRDRERDAKHVSLDMYKEKQYNLAIVELNVDSSDDPLKER